MKKKLPIVVFLLLFFILLSGLSLACDFCLLSQGISPLETISGAGGIRINQRYTMLNSVYKGTKDVTPAVKPKEEYWTTEVTGFYSIAEDLMLLAIVPLKKNTLDGHLHVHSDGDIEVHTDMKGDVSGLGDIALIGRYTFLKKHTIDTTGATDFIFGLSLNHSIQRLSLSANILDAIHTEGKAGDKTYQFGNIINYDVTGKYRVHPGELASERNQWFLALGINGELRDKEKEGGVTVDNSGGHTIYLTPGVQVVAAPHWVVEALYYHSIYHDLYGTQTGENYKASVGVTYLF